MTPDASQHDPSPEYIRALLSATGMTGREVAQAIGVSPRMLRYYIAESGAHCPAPYAVQFALESLALGD